MNSSRTVPMQMSSLWKASLLVLSIWGILIAGAPFLHFQLDVPLGNLTRDPADIFNVALYTGFVSQAGLLAWAAGAAVCLLSAQILPGEGPGRDIRRFLFVSGLLTLFLAFDDTFLIHDKLLPALGLHEVVAYSVYAILGLLYLIAFRGLILRTDYVLLAMALVFLGASVSLDTLLPPGETHFLVEDGSKILGSLFWLAYFYRVAVAAVREHLAPRGRGPAAT